MKRLLIIAIAIGLILPHTSIAQETVNTSWTLRQCIDYALENNLQIKQQEANCLQQQIQLSTTRNRRLPNLSAGVSQSFNFGRGLTQDNTYVNRNTQNTSFSLNTNVPLFTGMEIANSIALGKLNLKAAIEDLNKAKEDISIHITSAYLEVLYTKEIFKVAQEQVLLSKEQLKRSEEFFANGKLSEAEVAEAYSRVAQDEMSAVQAENHYRLSLLTLSQWLELPSPEGFYIEHPDTVVNEEPLQLPDLIYEYAVANKPQIQAAEYRLQGSKHSIRIAQSGLYPQLSVGAGISTGYYKTSGIDGRTFSQQWRDNNNKNIGFSLSIPIFNRFATRNQIRSAHIQQQNLAWQLEEGKKSLYKEIQQVYYNALAAQSKYRSSNTAMQATEASFRLMEAKYENGKATATAYNEVKTNLMKATADMLQAKYEFLFRSKILDFYNGIELK